MNDTLTDPCILILEMYRMVSDYLVEFKVFGIHIALLRPYRSFPRGLLARQM